MLAAPSIRDTRKGIELVFDNHGGGALRMVAMALNVSMPTSVRCCLSVCVSCLCGVWRERVSGRERVCVGAGCPCPHADIDASTALTTHTHTNTHTHTHTHMQVRDWLDDPYADEAAMAKLLRHPLVAQQLSTPDVMPEPVVLPVAT